MPLESIISALHRHRIIAFSRVAHSGSHVYVGPSESNIFCHIILTAPFSVFVGHEYIIFIHVTLIQSKHEKINGF